MADLFTELAIRVLGLGPTVQPLTRSLFEPFKPEEPPPFDEEELRSVVAELRSSESRPQSAIPKAMSEQRSPRADGPDAAPSVPPQLHEERLAPENFPALADDRSASGQEIVSPTYPLVPPVSEVVETEHENSTTRSKPLLRIYEEKDRRHAMKLNRSSTEETATKSDLVATSLDSDEETKAFPSRNLSGEGRESSSGTSVAASELLNRQQRATSAAANPPESRSASLILQERTAVEDRESTGPEPPLRVHGRTSESDDAPERGDEGPSEDGDFQAEWLQEAEFRGVSEGTPSLREPDETALQFGREDDTILAAKEQKATQKQPMVTPQPGKAQGYSDFRLPEQATGKPELRDGRMPYRETESTIAETEDEYATGKGSHRSKNPALVPTVIFPEHNSQTGDSAALIFAKVTDRPTERYDPASSSAQSPPLEPATTDEVSAQLSPTYPLVPPVSEVVETEHENSTTRSKPLLRIYEEKDRRHAMKLNRSSTEETATKSD
ncbi:MAG: hypothetical protein ACJ746_12565, partial [Bryobacteraceae bacterium]